MITKEMLLEGRSNENKVCEAGDTHFKRNPLQTLALQTSIQGSNLARYLGTAESP